MNKEKKILVYNIGCFEEEKIPYIYNSWASFGNYFKNYSNIELVPNEPYKKEDESLNKFNALFTEINNKSHSEIYDWIILCITGHGSNGNNDDWALPLKTKSLSGRDIINNLSIALSKKKIAIIINSCEGNIKDMTKQPEDMYSPFILRKKYFDSGFNGLNRFYRPKTKKRKFSFSDIPLKPKISNIILEPKFKTKFLVIFSFSADTVARTDNDQNTLSGVFADILSLVRSSFSIKEIYMFASLFLTFSRPIDQKPMLAICSNQKERRIKKILETEIDLSKYRDA